MKADFVFFGLDRTGGVLCMLRYLDALRRAGDEAVITTLGTRDDRRFVDPPAGVDVTYVGLRSRAYRALVRSTPGGLGFPTREINRLTAALPHADVHVASFALTVPAALQSNRGRVYSHVQHFDALIVPPGRARQVARDAYRADVYRTANCTWVAEQTIDAGGAIEGIITPGIDLETFRPGAPATAPLPDAPLRLLTLGKTVEWKGLVDVVSAARQLAQTRAVALVSYGPDKPRGRLGNAQLTHHGFVGATRLAELYRSATVCVSASWYESFPLPPLEAMACGVPVICTRLGTEDYAEHEVNCLIVPPKDPNAIAQAVERMADDSALRSELVTNGLATASRFTWDDAERAFVRHAHAALA